jgi:hypothetical protein
MLNGLHQTKQHPEAPENFLATGNSYAAKALLLFFVNQKLY